MLSEEYSNDYITKSVRFVVVDNKTYNVDRPDEKALACAFLNQKGVRSSHILAIEYVVDRDDPEVLLSDYLQYSIYTGQYLHSDREIRHHR